MTLNPNKGSVTTSGYQGVQGASKGTASFGASPSGKGVIKQGVSAKDTQKMPKSNKKKVIVGALLKMMVKGKRHPVES